MGAKCIPETDSYGRVMQLNTVQCSAIDPLSQKTQNGDVGHHESNEPSAAKGTLPAAKPPPTTAQTPTITTSAPPLVTPSAETRSLPGKLAHSRKQSNSSLKTNGSAKNGDSLSSFRSTSTMSSGSIASNFSQICEKYFIQPLIRSRSLPSNMGNNSSNPNGEGSRKIPYIHLRRRKGKCVRKFCMRFLPPAAACSGVIAVQLNMIADRQLGTPSPGTGDKPVYPFGFSKGNNGSERRVNALNNGAELRKSKVNTQKLQELRETEAVKQIVEERPLYDFFICHTEDDYIPFVDKLVKKCEKANIAIFSRSYSLLWGDSQRMDAELPISSAMFGIVLLSPTLLNSYRNSWCEKDLDVLFDRSTDQDMHRNMVLPIYCAGITKQQVQMKYPFLATQVAFVYEDTGVEGIIKQMKKVLERHLARKKQQQQRVPPPIVKTQVSEEKQQGGNALKTVSELDIECEMKNEDIGLICTPRPTSLHLDSEHPDTSNSSNTTDSASTPSKLNGVLKCSGSSRSSVKKTLRIDPDPQVFKKRSIYRSDGTVNHCCHCGQMSSKYKNARKCTQAELDKETLQMEELHRTEMAEDEATPDCSDEESDEEDDKFLGDPAILNDRLPMNISLLPYNLLHTLCIMLDPICTVGSDFSTFAAEIGFCTTYIRYLKALDIKKHSPFEEILLQWQDSAPDTTMGDLLYLLNEIKRYDAVDKLREYYNI